MELPGSTKDENGENVSHLEITEVVKILSSGFSFIDVWFTD